MLGYHQPQLRGMAKNHCTFIVITATAYRFMARGEQLGAT